MEPTKHPQLLHGFGFHMFPCEFSRAFIDNKRYRFHLGSAHGFCVVLSNDSRFHPFFCFPGVRGHSFPPIFFWPKWVRHPFRGTRISFLVGGRTNDTNAIVHHSFQSWEGRQHFKNLGHLFEWQRFFFCSMRFFSPQKCWNFFEHR